MSRHCDLGPPIGQAAADDSRNVTTFPNRADGNGRLVDASKDFTSIKSDAATTMMSAVFRSLLMAC